MLVETADEANLFTSRSELQLSSSIETSEAKEAREGERERERERDEWERTDGLTIK
tara:strand:+ start:791 stop:958 length:168 start_codon:yes stop_codon:yes gene_type:complete